MLSRYNRDADNVNARIEKVGAMSFRVHPHIVDDRRLASFSDILGDQRESHAGTGSTSGEIGLPWKAMRDIGMVRHLVGVVKSCLCQQRISL